MTPEEMTHLIQCMKCGNVVLYTAKDIIEAFEKKMQDAISAERAECAKIAETFQESSFNPGYSISGFLIAQAIRARGEK